MADSGEKPGENLKRKNTVPTDIKNQPEAATAEISSQIPVLAAIYKNGNEKLLERWSFELLLSVKEYLPCQ